MTLPGEGAPRLPDDEAIAADQQRMDDGVAQQAEVADIVAESRARIEPWEDSIDLALKVSTAVVAEYGARSKTGGKDEVEVDPEDGIPVVNDSDFMLAGLRPSTVIVQVEKNNLSVKEPRTWLDRYLSYAKETPVKYGWTVAERQVTGAGNASEEAEQAAEGGRLAGLLSDIDGPAPAAKPKVEIGDADEEDDAIPYDVDALVERVVVVNGAKNALLLIRGKRGELDKAFEDGKADAPTRIASLKLPKAGKDDKKDKVGKVKEGLEEYVGRNNFADVEVSVLSREAIEQGKVDLEDPAEMADLVYGGLCRLVEKVRESRVDRGVLPPTARQA